MHLFAVGMRVFSTGIRPHFIDATSIVVIEERTRRFLKHVVVVFVQAQVSLYQLRRLNPKVLRDAVNVTVFEDRASSLATVGAIQAIQLFENGIVIFMEQPIYLLFRESF